jgi:UDP-N-acetylglucosamine--N-acetylmuramyl-(pentapeptide) pyrophosphoryl-undecaprenol N-acetylglucosamine transferase
VSTLLVAASGGHLVELYQLRPRLTGVDEDVVWVTFDTPQSRSLLAGEEVVFVEDAPTRDAGAVVRNLGPAIRLLRRPDVTSVISTGASIALSFLPLARARGIPTHYIESATRAVAPSLTGRLLQSLPGIALYAQHRSWAYGRWRWAGSVFDGYATERRPARPALRRVVVTLGSHPHFGFRRLVERLVATLPAGAEVLWQTGATDVRGLPVQARRAVPHAELRAAMADADLVVAHAGVGSALAALDAGKAPLLVPRDPAFGEHVDDHQLQVAYTLQKLGVATVRRVGDLTAETLADAASLRAARVRTPAPFVLAEAGSPSLSARAW